MFSIIVPVFDPFDRFVSFGAIKRTLGKVFTLEGNYELIVVNNNPIGISPHLTQYLIALVNSHPEKMKIVEPNTNLGTAQGFNAGLRVAQSDSQYLVFMSSDTDIVDKEMLKKIQQALESNPRVGIAHPFSVYEDSNEYNFSSKYNHKAFVQMIQQKLSSESAEIPDNEIQRILKDVSVREGIKAPLPTMPLTFAVITRKLIEHIGSFDEGVQMGCHENNDLSYRALLSGYTVARLNNVFVNHLRLLFHNLGASGAQQCYASYAMPHLEPLKQSTVWWNKKWGKPYIELYTRWRWGLFVYIIMLPYFWLRRLGIFINGTLSKIIGKQQNVLSMKRNISK